VGRLFFRQRPKTGFNKFREKDKRYDKIEAD
jgi:hypothetical protein